MTAPILGVDIAKQRVEVALLVDGKVKNKSFKNAPDGFEALALWLRKLGIERVQVCLKTTGNYGDDLAIYLHEAGHTVNIVNPARIKGFAQSELVRTKTDKIDAGIIARFCLAMKPESWIPPSSEIRSLRALVRRADSLIDMMTQEKNRLGTAHESVIPLIKGHINYLGEEIEKVRSQIADLIDQDPNLKQKKTCWLPSQVLARQPSLLSWPNWIALKSSKTLRTGGIYWACSKRNTVRIIH